MGEVLARCPESFLVLSGDDGMTLPLMALGGHGVISTVANVDPARMRGLVRAARSGDFEKARKLHFELLPLLEALFCETNPIPVKAALAHMGLIGSEIRLPLLPLSPQGHARVDAALASLGLIR